MKNAISLFALSVVVLFSCNKYEHHVTVDSTPCELCGFADSITGMYKGFYWALYVPPGVNTTTDTFEYQVNHIFLDKGDPIDSTVMFFEVLGQWQTFATPMILDTIVLNARNGEVFSDYTIYNLNPDSVHLVDHFQSGPGTTMKYIDYKGYKQ